MLKEIFQVKTVKNLSAAVCKDCIYFKPTHQVELSKCDRFANKNILSGEITNEYAANCRTNELLCGQSAKQFTTKEFSRYAYPYKSPTYKE